MLKEIQKKVDELRIKVYAGQNNELTERALYDIEQMLFKAMDLQLNKPDVSGSLSDWKCGEGENKCNCEKESDCGYIEFERGVKELRGNDR